jgi:predicted hotdog family 3-hydroxylacyl-ACP dehydratase
MPLTPVSDLTIEGLIPHRRPMRLIDAILAVDDDSATTAATVTADWPRDDTGEIPTILLVELVAQTAAVSGGFRESHETDTRGTHGGLLVGIKQAVFHLQALPMGTKLVTRAAIRPLLDHYKEITGEVRLDDRPVAEMTLQSLQLELDKPDASR